MKKVLCTILGLMICLTIQAQETKEKKKGKEKINNAVNSGINKLGGLLKKKKKKNDTTSSTETSTDTKESKTTTGNPNFNLNGLLGGGAPLDMKASYSFGADMRFDVTMYENGKESKPEKMAFQYFFPKAEADQYLGFKLQGESLKESGASDMMMIMDKGQMLTFITQENMKIVNGTVIPNTENSSDGETADKTDDDSIETPEFKKTGRTKTILGHTCEEYTSETEEYTMSCWIAPSLKKELNGMSAMFLAINPGKTVNEGAFDGSTMGTILEMETYDKKSKDKFMMKATELNLEKETNFSTAGYQQINMKGFMKGNKE